MKMRKVYIAGKVTGDPEYREKFEAAEQHLRETGCFAEDAIINPAKACPDGWSWLRCMLHCMRLLAGCSMVLFLPDWRESRGAKIEHLEARMLRKHIVYTNQKQMKTWRH